MRNPGPRISPWFLLGSLVVGLATAVPGFALPPSGEAAATRADALIANVAHGDVDAAFHNAEDWRRPDDDAFDVRLEHLKQAVAAQGSELGAPTSVQLREETHFVEACVQRDYLVRYTGGSRDWVVKYRHGSKGWYLYDLAVPGVGG